MPKYIVTLKETVLYTVEVEAADEEEASEMAQAIWVDSEDPTNDFCGEGEGVTTKIVLEKQ